MKSVLVLSALCALALACPPEWSYLPASQKCYYNYMLSLTFEDAGNVCRGFYGARLARIESAKENEFLQLVSGDEYNTPAYASWVGAPESNYNNWCPGVDQSDDGLCVQFVTNNGCWNKVKCDRTEKAPFFCEMPYYPKPATTFGVTLLNVQVQKGEGVYYNSTSTEFRGCAAVILANNLGNNVFYEAYENEPKCRVFSSISETTTPTKHEVGNLNLLSTDGTTPEQALRKMCPTCPWKIISYGK
ncbi:hypothetical protein QR680_015937 [Steinernema hermaphroditum]|uniref:C-type lectin domain-containing protein n=1 Tax=Steinernema hermaphroditum TaxID=289476 RepID=A0AA39H9G9_9BILA|nr:hypothetical protein QR680_015937 [Steinernema hermaphroditum]